DWVIAWDDQLPIKQGDHFRFARLRIFPDGRVRALQSLRDPLVETKLSAGEISELVNWLIEAAHATERQPLNIKAEPELNLKNRGDPLPASLWNQHGSRISIQREGKVYDLVSIEPPLPDNNGPVSHERFKVAQDRLKQFVSLAVVGGHAAEDRLIQFANAELKKKYPETPIRLSAENLYSAGHDADGTVAVTFYFSSRETKFNFPTGEITLRIPPGGEAYVDKAAYWTSKAEGQRWGRSLKK
ncbi:MAG: hypothetical protein JWM11_57, partial [Planctomycetaceae bacterium]|nr:hypothetical protein [Planctomycetaceae bacterium]